MRSAWCAASICDALTWSPATCASLKCAVVDAARSGSQKPRETLTATSAPRRTERIDSEEMLKRCCRGSRRSACQSKVSAPLTVRTSDVKPARARAAIASVIDIGDACASERSGVCAGSAGCAGCAESKSASTFDSSSMASSTHMTVAARASRCGDPDTNERSASYSNGLRTYQLEYLGSQEMEPADAGTRRKEHSSASMLSLVCCCCCCPATVVVSMRTLTVVIGVIMRGIEPDDSAE